VNFRFIVPMNSPVHEGRLVYAVAPLIGLAAWPVASWFGSGVLRFYAGPASTIVPVLLVASLAGLVVGTVASAEAESERAQEFKETATRAGFVAALVAAAVLVVRATILHGTVGQMSGPGLITLFHAVVTLLPATLFGMFMGAVGGAGRVAILGNPDLGKPAFSFRPIHALYAVCALAFLAPFLPGFLSPPRPPDIAPRPSPTMEPSAPEAPAFAYEKPTGFATAEAMRFQIVASKTIEGVRSNEPMLISPDGRWFAFHSRRDDPPSLLIYDLDSFTEVARFSQGAALSALAWSPDSKRIVGLFQSDDARSIGIVTVAEKRVIPLPRPESSDIPDGSLSWPEAEEVILHTPNRPALALNLDRLEWRPLSIAAFDKAKQEKFAIAPVAAPPRMLKSSLDLAWTLSSAKPRSADGGFNLESSGRTCVVATDAGQGIRRHFPEMEIQADDRVLFAADGTKVIVARNSTATVFYFGLRDLPTLTRRVEMKGTSINPHFAVPGFAYMSAYEC